ncbi:MAG TPA: hypothetical protein VG406_01210 [Isosphaeraceae bacterium]|nr:hypothetical protein [Isosphaeraceae bacterium]
MALPWMNCPECRKAIKGRDAMIGRNVRCPYCSGRFVFVDQSGIDLGIALRDEDESDDSPSSPSPSAKAAFLPPPAAPGVKRPQLSESWIYGFLDAVSLLLICVAVMQFVIVIVVVVRQSHSYSDAAADYSSYSYSTPRPTPSPSWSGGPLVVASLIFGIGTFITGTWGMLAVDIGRNIRIARLRLDQAAMARPPT